ncbi:peptidoglycan-binding protein [Streptomyces formicae]|uniref:Peptidoglycan-binding protein n=1 Tax=Streptomyces formicae TaxID=1616117 RepID=A0ABY3X0C2_9ACTN|nr:peptidoglycan-binding protein [Streptomyces formicae]
MAADPHRRRPPGAVHQLLAEDVRRPGHRQVPGRHGGGRRHHRRVEPRHPGGQRPLQRHRGLHLHGLLQGGRAVLPVRLDRAAAQQRLSVGLLLQRRLRHQGRRRRVRQQRLHTGRPPLLRLVERRRRHRHRYVRAGKPLVRPPADPPVRGRGHQSYGGYSINIDRDYLDVGTGTPPTPTCTGANLDFTAYATVQSGATGDHVKAAQCLLKAAGHDPGTPDGVFGPSTTTAARNFQTGKGLTADGVVGPKTWTALLSRGSTPTVQNGSTGEAVTRLQRALTAALGRTVAIDGVFGSGTAQAVSDYQSSRGLGADGIVGPATWGALQAGR